MSIQSDRYLSNYHCFLTKNIKNKYHRNQQTPYSAYQSGFNFQDKVLDLCGKGNLMSISHRRILTNKTYNSKKVSHAKHRRKPLSEKNENCHKLYVPKEKKLYKRLSQKAQSKSKEDPIVFDSVVGINTKKSNWLAQQQNYISNTRYLQVKKNNFVWENLLNQCQQKFDNYKKQGSIHLCYSLKSRILQECIQRYPSLSESELQFLTAVIYIQRKWREKAIQRIISSYNLSKQAYDSTNYTQLSITYKTKQIQRQSVFLKCIENNNTVLQKSTNTINKQKPVNNKEFIFQKYILEIIGSFGKVKQVLNKRKSHQFKYKTFREKNKEHSLYLKKNSRQLGDNSVNFGLSEHKHLHLRMQVNKQIITKISQKIFLEFIHQLKQQIQIQNQIDTFCMNKIALRSNETIVRFYNVVENIIFQNWKQIQIQSMLRCQSVDNLRFQQDKQSFAKQACRQIDFRSIQFLNLVEEQYLRLDVRFIDCKFEKIIRALMRIEIKLFLDCYAQFIDKQRYQNLNYGWVHTAKFKSIRKFKFVHQDIRQKIKVLTNKVNLDNSFQVNQIQQLFDFSIISEQLLILREQFFSQIQDQILYQFLMEICRSCRLLNQQR